MLTKPDNVLQIGRFPSLESIVEQPNNPTGFMEGSPEWQTLRQRSLAQS